MIHLSRLSYATPVVGDEDDCTQRLQSRSLYGEEIDGPDVRSVAREEGPPRLRQWPPKLPCP